MTDLIILVLFTNTEFFTAIRLLFAHIGWWVWLLWKQKYLTIILIWKRNWLICSLVQQYKGYINTQYLVVVENGYRQHYLERSL